MKLALLLLSMFLFSFAHGMNDCEREHKQAQAEMVLDQLYHTIGNFSTLKPEIIISLETTKVAAFYPRQNTIEIEYKAFDICSFFGKDSLSALAFIIAHELAHSFHHETGEEDAHTNYLAFDLAVSSDKREEYEADLHGLFNAYLAGFKTVDLLPQIIQKIYESYDLLDKELNAYPSLEVRKQSAYEIKQKVEELIHLYEAANAIAAIGKYKLAAASYQFIENAFQGREIYNNIGVNYALHAINFTEEDVDVFLYPLELDWDTRIKKPKAFQGSKSLNQAQQKYRIKYLTKAKRQLEKSIQLDPEYLIPSVNMICVLSLLGEYSNAITYYDNSQMAQMNGSSKNKTINIVSAELAVAVAYVNQNTPQSIRKARAIWEKYQNHSNPLVAYQAAYNLKMLSEEKCDPYKTYECNLPFTPNLTIDKVQLNKVNYPNKTLIDKNNNISVAIQKKKNSIVYQYTGNETNFVYQNITNGFRKEKIQLSPSELFQTTTLSNGFFMVCEKTKTIVRLDQEGSIVAYGKYK